MHLSSNFFDFRCSFVNSWEILNKNGTIYSNGFIIFEIFFFIVTLLEKKNCISLKFAQNINISSFYTRKNVQNILAIFELFIGILILFRID